MVVVAVTVTVVENYHFHDVLQTVKVKSFVGGKQEVCDTSSVLKSPKLTPKKFNFRGGKGGQSGRKVPKFAPKKGATVRTQTFQQKKAEVGVLTSLKYPRETGVSTYNLPSKFLIFTKFSYQFDS